MYKAQQQDLLNRWLDQFASQKPLEDTQSFLRFSSRLSANFYVINQLFRELYGHRKDCEEHLQRLVGILYKSYQQRHQSLKELDQVREQDPNWLLNENWVGMMLYLDHFTKDLKSFKDKIDYLQELGINWVHLMPLLQSPDDESDGGYAVSDYRKVDKRYGSMADIRSIAKEFRNRGMLLTLDLVLNHTSNQHQWAKKALKGQKQYQDYYYMFEDRQIPDQFEAYMPEVFPVSNPGNFTYLEEIEKWVMTVFHKYQWDLNYRNPQVFGEMIEVLLFLANQGVDILRLDAPAFLWKEMGTTCQNLPKAHSLLKLMKRCTEIVAPGVKFIAEAIVAPLEIMKYFGQDADDHECEIAYHATLMALIWEALATGEARLLNKVIKNLPQKPFGTTWINYVRCHDDIGLGFDDQYIYELGLDARLHRNFILDYYTGKFEGSPSKGAPFMFNPKNGDARLSGTLASLAGLEMGLEQKDQDLVDRSIDKIILAHSIIMSFGGLPLIYSGDEIGLCNDYGYQQELAKAYDNRWMHRPKMDWKAAKKRTKKGSIEYRIFNALKHLIQIRANSPEWADLNNTELCYCENKHILAYLRWNDVGRKTLILANFHNSEQFVKKDILFRLGFDMARGVIDKFSGKPPDYHQELIVMQPYQFYWISDKKYYNQRLAKKTK